MPLDPTLAMLAAAGADNPNVKPTHELSPEEARAGYSALGRMFGEGEPVASVVDRRVPGPGGEIALRIYTPRGEAPFPVFVFYHGGGWVIGDLDTHDKECRAICNAAGCVVVSVDYRLAPEHRFPAAPDDAFAALQWVAANADSLGGDASRLAVGGDSAGGNLAAVVSLLARDAGSPDIRFQLLVYPCVDLRSDVYASRDENAAGPFLLKETIDYFTAHYVGDDETARTDVKASPILADSHASLPPALVVTAEFDPLRDEGEAYARALEQAGVPVTLSRYDGMAHVFFQLSPAVADAKRLLDECAAALRSALD